MWVHWVPVHDRKQALVCLTNSWLSFTPVLIELDVALYSPLNTHRRSESVCRILDMFELRIWLRPLTSFIQLSGKASDYITYTHIFCRDISSSYRWKFFITTQEQDWAAVIMMAFKFHQETILCSRVLVVLGFAGLMWRSFLIVRVPEGWTIRTMDQHLQDLWHQLLTKNLSLSFHHPRLFRWVKPFRIEYLLVLIFRFLYGNKGLHSVVITCFVNS